MIDEFAKFDGSERLSLDDVFKDLGTTEDGGFWDELGEALQKYIDASATPELDGYFPYKLIVGDRHYYPRVDTLRKLSTGWVIFVDELTSPDDQKPCYVTVQHSVITAIYWLPKREDEAEEVEIPLAA